MPQLFNITNWNPQPWYNTGGTRSKKYIQNPLDGKYYYFKKSYKTKGRDYYFEFWSEIIATEIGRMHGFNVLRYDIAIDNEEMGCISESMLKNENEALIEGGRYLQAYDMRFDPNVKEGRKFHSFQLIEEAFKFYKLDSINNIIEIIVFDSIIGNGDRHQENWAFINELSFSNKATHITYDLEKNKLKQDAFIPDLHFKKPKSFAPIFDNGSSLGRELEEEKINRMLTNERELTAYINRGVSEIHWNKAKMNHIALIKKLLESPYNELTLNTLKRIVKLFDKEEVERLLFSIDDEIPDNFIRYKLSESRKRLILELVTLRMEQLQSLIL